jgi:uncharacterized DUF497 family protein
MGATLVPDEDFATWLSRWSGEFDWDEGNRWKPEKHGLDAQRVEKLFDSFHFYAGRPSPSPAEWGEERDVVYLHDDLSGRHYTAAVTRRGDALRVVTCRRAWPKEIERYDRERERFARSEDV